MFCVCEKKGNRAKEEKFKGEKFRPQLVFTSVISKADAATT